MSNTRSPDSDLTTYELYASRAGPKRTTVDTGSTEFVVGDDVNPVEFFLGSIAACLNSTGTMVARDMGVRIDDLEVTVEGGVDYDRYAGRETDARAGLQDVRVTIEIDTGTDEETIEEWFDTVKDRCPVTDNVDNETSLALVVEST